VTRPDPLAGFRRQRHRTFELEVDALEESNGGFAQSVVRGLSDHPRWLDCRWLYDATGSEIFERICEQPEYYQTRTEAALLHAHAPEIRRRAPAPTLVELGSGSSTKTRHLLRAWTAAGSARYVPVDVSRTMLARSCAAIAAEHPGLEVRGIAASYDRAFPLFREVSPLVLVFLGSTIGNLNPEETAGFLDRVSASLAPGDHFLLGIDLVKDVRTIEAAYNDAAGWSAAFTRNLFARMNRELGTALDLSAIEHVAYYNGHLDRIEIYARFTREAEIALPDFGRRFRIAPGEMILTEISRKFQVDEVAANTARFGFETVRTFTDPERRFAVLLLRMGTRRAVTADRERSCLTHLAEARARTLELIEPLTDEQLVNQHSPLMSPIVWDLGHIANFEELWSIRALDPTAGVGDAARDRMYDAISHPRAKRKDLPLPDRDGALDYLHTVRAETRRRLAHVAFDPSDPLLYDGYVYKMIAQHEAQHGETILQTIQLIPDCVYEPPRRREPPGAAIPVDAEYAVVPAGPFLMGTDDRTFAYDNERPQHVVELPRYRIDLAPVTNGQYLAFMRDGGYRRRECWSEAGWRWLRAAAVTHPANWMPGPGGSWGERAFGRVSPLVLDRPVIHVSWYEADAYARWAGKRLPTEAEWEKAAAWDAERRVACRFPWGDAPPTEDHANLDQRTFAPAAVGAYPRGRSFFGCHQMIGDVWEWTATDFGPYPGFVAFPYREYSEVHFGRGYKVLRGGSWATRPIAVRNTFRNWDLPERRQIFAGFRCAADA
jgi:iron(II)-dependent oxidoreductase